MRHPEGHPGSVTGSWERGGLKAQVGAARSLYRLAAEALQLSYANCTHPYVRVPRVFSRFFSETDI